MYAAYFGLRQEPFSIAPDPRLLFMSEQHREALAHLLYGVQGGGGFVLLTGEIGTGKTTVCRSFLEQVPAHCNLAYIFNPKLTVLELLETVCHEFGIEVRARDLLPPTVKDYLDPLNAFLLQAHGAGRNNVLVIDEAQNLSAEVLEQLRLLTNLETSERKLLQIILIGQPELREMLARPELEQLAQRVIARYHLRALSASETEQYIRHRLEVCGLHRPLPFDRRALQRIHVLTGGVPRRINLLCDRALLGAYGSGQAVATRAIVDGAAAEVFPPQRPRGAPAWRRTALAAGLGLAAGAGLLAAVTGVGRPDAPLPVVAVPSKPAMPPAGVQASSNAEAQPAGGAPVPATAASVATAAAPTSIAVAAVPAPAPKPTLWRSEADAWRELAQAWQFTLGPGEPCAQLAQQQVYCFSRNLSLPMIRQLARPGIVKLDVATGQPSYAILAALTEQSATLQAAGTEQTVTLPALAERWQGDFATLWRAPVAWPAAGLREGQDGPAVNWIASELAKTRGQRPPTGPRRLDARLRDDLRTFQVAQGLPADGLPGPLTFMQLNRASGVDEPRLRTEP